MGFEKLLPAKCVFMSLPKTVALTHAVMAESLKVCSFFFHSRYDQKIDRYGFAAFLSAIGLCRSPRGSTGLPGGDLG